MSTSLTEEQRSWLFASSKPRYFSRRHRFLKEHDRWRKVASLRKEYLRYGKMKLLAIYRQRHPEETTISAWKVQCIIKASGLYYSPLKQARTNRKRSRTHARKKITELQRKPVSGFLLCLDTVVRHWSGTKRYILTAIDRHTKIAFARM